MSADLRVENVLIQVRAVLQDTGVKLWLPPYYHEGIGTCEDEIEKLARDYCQLLNIPFDHCVAALNELQNNALDKLRAQGNFTRTGIATVKVRVPCQVGGTRLITIQVKLTDPGSALYNLVSTEINVPENRMKLISSGKVLNLENPLDQQGLKNNQQVMAVTLPVDKDQASNDENLHDRVRKAKEDAAFLISRDKDSFMHMEDQEGNTIHLPPEERHSLMLALALHEKGKAALKRDEFSEALVLFLESDQAYKACNSRLLESVDNFALLNLDIAWCYLCLKSVTQLPDAESRLLSCERSLKKIYGENLNRVEKLKGSSGNERALIMRLHLLQGVLYFHQNRRMEAQTMLQLADSELRGLKVDESTVMSLAEMGYTVNEARMALRATAGNIDQAITHIIELQEHRKEARRRGRKERALTKHTNSTNVWINPRNLHNLVEMGFPKEVAIVALRKTKNDVPTAVSLLQGNFDQLLQEVPKLQASNISLTKEIAKMGFNVNAVKYALDRVTEPTVDKIVEQLLKMQSEGTYEEYSQTPVTTSSSESDTDAMGATAAAAGEGGSCSSDACALSANTDPDRDQTSDSSDHEAAQEAYNRFTKDVATEDDAYLDLPLVQEENIIMEYKKFLNM